LQDLLALICPWLPEVDQILAIRPLDDEYALRVAYRRINDNILVVTFYPVRRERFHV